MDQPRPISDFLTSISAVILPMLLLLVAFVIDAGVLFYRVLPDMPLLLKLSASAFLGFALSFPLLIAAVNSRILPRIGWFGFPELFAIFSAFMTALFFDVFTPQDAHWSWYVLVAFLSVFLGLIDYLYAYLFIEKYRRANATDKKLALLEKLQPEHDQLKAAFNEQSAALKAAQTALKEYHRQLTCKHCGQLVPEGFGALRNHIQRKCPNKPNAGASVPLVPLTKPQKP